MNDRLAYPPREASKAIGVGLTRLYALIAEGKIEARRCGRRTLIPADSLRQFITALPRR
jgi:excisionase family DNA binding protein